MSEELMESGQRNLSHQETPNRSRTALEEQGATPALSLPFSQKN